MLFEKIAELNLARVMVLSPSTWWEKRCIDCVKHNYELHCLERVGNSFYTLRLRGLKQYIEDFSPDILYSLAEPHTILARECAKIAKEKNIPFAVFSWENTNRGFGHPYDDIEAEVIKKADILVAGNEGAKKRYIAKGVGEEKISVCPQTGLDTSLFHPIKGMRKVYDAGYFGRMVEEKGCRYIEHVVKELKLKMLWIGGHGLFKPSYGTYVEWLDYLKMPGYYNRIKLFVHFPYPYQGFSEQYAYTLAESMACGTPVVTSDNGSIQEVYSEAPIVRVEEGSEIALKRALSYSLSNLETYPKKEGIKWVKDNLSLEVIGKKLIKILEKCGN